MSQVFNLILPDHLQQFVQETIDAQNNSSSVEDYLCKLVQREFEEKQSVAFLEQELSEALLTPIEQYADFDVELLIAKATARRQQRAG